MIAALARARANRTRNLDKRTCRKARRHFSKSKQYCTAKCRRRYKDTHSFDIEKQICVKNVKKVISEIVKDVISDVNNAIEKS